MPGSGGYKHAHPDGAADDGDGNEANDDRYKGQERMGA
jgi:hypothetical protein